MSKDIKQSLRDANAAFKNKENDKAIRICKEILRSDKGNYMAHVLLGAIYQDSSRAEAEKYLRKAVTLSKEPISALQGLAKCVPAEECPEIYGQLLELTPNKFEELHGKLLRSSLELPDISKSVEIFEKEISLEDNESNRKRIHSAYINLSEMLVKQKEVEDKFTNIFYDSLMKTLHAKDIYQQERYKKCLKLLNKMGQNDLLVEKSIEMHGIFKNDQYPLEWICKVYLDSEEDLPVKMDSYIDGLLEKSPKSAIGLLSKARLLLNDGRVIEARNLVDAVLKETPNWTKALKMMAKIHLITEAYPLAAHIWEQLKLEDESSRQQEVLDICEGFVDPERAGVLLRKPENLLKDNERQLSFLKAFFAMKINDDAQEALNLLESISLDTLNYLLLKGEVLYKLERFQASLDCFSKAISSYPTSSRAFYWLSRIHKQMDNQDKEKENLEHCILLNPVHKDAVLTLCNIYKSEGSDKVEKLLLESAIYAKDVSLKWIWLHLGLHYISVGKNDAAINTLRTVLRFDKKDYLAWEALADAYFNNGSYSSALKIYQSILEETDNTVNIYCRYQVANIKTRLGQYSDAIRSFVDILEAQPTYVAALKGVAEAHFALGNVFMRQRRLGSMRDQLQKAAFYATLACELKSVCCHWSLLGNILIKVANLPKKLAFVEVSSALTSDGVTNLREDEIYQLSSNCFLRAIKENPKDNLLWYNLAACLYFRASRVSDKAKRQEFLRKAMLYVKQSIALKNNRWQNWNMLGVISVKLANVSLAVHCFVKALRLKKTSAMSWSNLGLMYLDEGEKWMKYLGDEQAVWEEFQKMSWSANRSANIAFGRSQQSNTEYMNAWIGQAILAERLMKKDSAMDLHRHCTQLGYHGESAVGYSRFVCDILNDPERLKETRFQYSIEKMFALPRAHDSMTWYIADQDDKATAAELCLEGCLAYKSGLYQKASNAFESALKIAGNSQDRDKIACNLAHCKLKQNKFSEAIQVFEMVQESTYRSALGLAFAYFKDEQFEKSYSVYDNLLQLESLTTMEQATILIAMSSMIYVFHNQDDTKGVLYQFLNLPNPPLEGFYSACALGILNGDIQLAELVVKELNKVDMRDNSCHHIAFLSSQFYLLKEGKNEALQYLLKLLHKYPQRAKLRKVVAGFLLKNFTDTPKYLKFAARLAQGVLQIEFRQIDKKCSPVSSAKCLMLAFEAMQLLNDDSKRHFVQKAIHLNPACRENWNLLRSIA